MAKICIINSLYEPYRRSGAETVVKKIITGLLELNHDVIFITLGREKEVEKKGRLTIYRIKPWNIFSFIDIAKYPIWMRWFWHPLDVFNFFGANQVSAILKSQKPSVVMTHNLKGIGYMVPRIIKKAGIKHIHTLHDVQLSRPSGLILFKERKPFLIIDKIYEKLSRMQFGSPDVVISPSKWLMKYYRRLGFFSKSKQVILLNPAELSSQKKIIQPIGKSRVITFLFVGQLERHKGVLMLIETLKQVKSQNWKLILIGSGSLENQIREEIAKDSRFELIGWVPLEKLYCRYRQADLTVVPSLCYENSPTSVTESLMANTPVIASDIGGISETVKDNYNGFTFAPGNKKNLQEVLEYFLRHPGEIDVLRKNAFVSVRHVSVNAYLKKLLGLF